MSELTARQRTKINAALCLIHDNGLGADTVIRTANDLIKQGMDTRSAYEDALNAFAEVEPSLTPVITKVLRLVEASDDRTVDQYDAALSEYVTTGNDSSLNALAPMIAEDSLALAVKEGEITPEEAANGDLSKALGFEPGPALQEAMASKAEEQTSSESQPQEGQPWQKPEGPPVAQLGTKPPATNVVNGSQVSFGGATGMVAAGAARNWSRNTAASLPNGAVEAPAI